MPMEINMQTVSDGCSHTMAFLVACVERSNEKVSFLKRFNDLITVQFRCLQSSAHPYFLQTEIDVHTSSKDCNVKVKVSSSEYNYCKTKIYADEKFWEVIGGKLCSILDEGETRIFHFSVSIHVCKMEAMHEMLYNDNEFTDFRLSTDEGSVAVHKACIAAQSDVFKAMLNKEWIEGKEGRIQMKGVSLQTLQHLKDYMYLRTLPDDVLPLLSIASCYMIESLKDDCLWRLSQNIKPENFYDMLESSIVNKNPELTFAILKATPSYIVTEAKKIYMEKRDKEETKEE